MPAWIPGQGFWLVQASRDYSKAELAREMAVFEKEIKKAERFHAEKKELQFNVGTLCVHNMQQTHD